MPDPDQMRAADPSPFAFVERLPSVKVITPVLALVVMLGALVFTLIPFSAAQGRVSCQPALHGAAATRNSPQIAGGSGRACRDRGDSRLTMAETVAIGAALIAGVAVAVPDRRGASRAPYGVRSA